MSIKLTILMPCLNEAETLAICIKKAHQGAHRAGIKEYEVLIADNGSTDDSKIIAEKENARVIDVPIKGYGAALKAGIASAKGKYIIMGDSDDSYDFLNIKPFIELLEKGYELVMGSRRKGKIMPGAMPFLHKYLGNPILTLIGNLFYGCKLSDFHCGMRAFSKKAILSLGLRTNGMEFASEMVIRASLQDLKRTEIPITLHKDKRSRPPHLRTWRDGWRHLQFMLLYSPRWLFFYPGIATASLGFVIWLLLLRGEVRINNISFDVHTMLAGITMIILGSFLVFLAAFARLYAARLGLLPKRQWLEKIVNKISLEYGLALGVIVFLCGALLYMNGLLTWQKSDFGKLDYRQTLRTVISGTLFVVLGVQIFFSSYIISLLNIQKEE